MGLEAAELARWTRFAAKGGIGKCTALCDFKAANPDDLMFLKDDEITVLLQIPDKDNYYLGYCEGVVGRFCGSDVQFHSKLKKPVMTKRTSISTSSVTNKSPTPSSPSPSVQHHPGSRRGSLSSRRESVSSNTHGRTTPNRPQTLPPSLRSQASEESEREGKERRGTYAMGMGITVTPPVPQHHHPQHSNTPSFSYSTSSGPDSVLNTPNLSGSFSPPPDLRKPLFNDDSGPGSVTSPPQGPLPPAPHQPPQQQQQHKYITNAPPPLTLASSNQHPSAPGGVRAATNPLRILKRSGTLTSGNAGPGVSPPPANMVSFRESVAQVQVQTHTAPSSSSNSPAHPTPITQTLLVPPPASSQPLSAPPSTTTTPLVPPSALLNQEPPSKHLSLAKPASIADAHAGIGMSLLSGLMGDMDSDEDDDSDDGGAILAKAKERMGLGGTAASSPVMRRIVDEGSEDERWSQSSMDPNSLPNSANEVKKTNEAVEEQEEEDRRASWSESGEGTVEGLMYGRDEEEDVTAKGAPVVPPPRGSSSSSAAIITTTTTISNATSTIPFVNPAYLSPATSPTTPSFNPSSPPSSIRSRNDSHFGASQPYFSPPSQSYAQLNGERERRPSNATVASVKSSASKATVNTQSSWEGAADIYDDYRYSRYSMTRMSVFGVPGGVPPSGSVGSGSVAGEGSTRTRTDSNSTTYTTHTSSSQPLSPLTRDRVDSTASAGVFNKLAIMAEEEQSPPPSANTFGHVSRVESVVGSLAESQMGSVGEFGSRGGSMAEFGSRGGSIGDFGSRVGSMGTFGANGSGYNTPMGTGSASPGPGMMNAGGLKVAGEGEGRDRRSKRASRRHTRRLEGLVGGGGGGGGEADDGEDSDGSVYSKNSRDSRLSIGSLDDAPMSPVLANPGAFASLSSFSSQSPATSNTTSAHTSTATNGSGTGNIPPPLDLSNKPNPLLNTSFASPGSNTTSPRTSETEAFSPSLATGLSSLNNWTGAGMVMGSVVSGRIGGDESGDEVGERGTGMVGGQNVGGIASRMRMMLEEARVGSPALVSNDTSMDEGRSRDTITGLEERIVVEDEEELPSRIEDTVETMDTSMLSMMGDLGGVVRGSLMRGVDVRPQSAIVEGGDETVGDISLDSLASKPDDSFEPSTPPNRSITLLSTPASPPSVSSTPPQPSHLRPSMRELREGATIPIPGTNQRRSIFLPHPNAPKPPPVEVDESGRERGPMYIVSPGLAPSSGLGAAPHDGVQSSATPPLQTRTPPPGFGGPPGPGSNPNASGPFPPLGPGLPRAPHPSQLPLHPSRPHPHLVGVIKMALSLPPPPARAPSASGPGGAKPLGPVHRGPTIYARFDTDLANSLGPVPVMWSVEPAPARAPGATLPLAGGTGGMPLHSHPHQLQHQPPHQQAPSQGPPHLMSPPRVASMGSQSSTAMNPGVQHGQQRQSQPAPMRRGSASVMSDSEIMRSRGSAGEGPATRMSGASSTGGSNAVGGGLNAPGGNVTSGEETSSKNPIPRANFFPKKPGMRPRSRSFSGFNSTTAEVAMPVQRGNEKAEIPSASEIKRSLTTSSSTSAAKLASGAPSPTLPPPSSSPPKSSPLSLSSSPPTSSALSLNTPATAKPAKSSPLRPSPLSLSTTSADPPMKPPAPLGGIKSPSSPLAKSVFSRDEVEKKADKENESDKEREKEKEEKEKEKEPNTLSPFTSPVLGGRNELRSVTSRSTLNDAILSRSPPTIAIKPSSDSGPSHPSHPSQGRIGSLQSPPQRRETDPASLVDNTYSRPSTDDTRSVTVISPPPSTSPTITRKTSLRAKLSLPNLRRNRNRQDDDTLQSPLTPLTPLSITGSYTFASAQGQAQAQALGLGLGGDSEMLQVQDMEFELVRPNFALGAARASEDSGVLGREGSLDLRMGGGGSSAIGTPGSLGADSAGGGPGSIADATSNDFLRAESPMSFVSSSAAAETASIAASLAKEKNRGQKEKEAEAANMEAHRARELKWMSLISSFSSTAPTPVAASNSTGANTIGAGGGVSVPTATLTAAQARKSKKVKKLVHEGIPASVRYLVWSFLTDGKARCVPGVYLQLCDREFKRAGVLGDIERDASKMLSGSGFEGSVGGRERGMTGDEGDVEARADTRQGVVSLLQAYLNMVPDVVYDIGLIHITSTLLLLAPEEDAFWIFVSIMDTHIRPYFSPPPPSTTSTPPTFPVSMSLEVDSMLFAKALENNEPQLARRILSDIGIPKEQLIGGWMRSLFVRALPGEVAVRVWDVFLYEGLPFLMRTALALTSLLKRPILELPPTPQSQRSLLNILLSPSSSLIPAPEIFLALAWGVKFKDEDFKKTREKEVKEREKKLDSGRRVANAGGLLGTLGASRGMGISLPRI